MEPADMTARWQSLLLGTAGFALLLAVWEAAGHSLGNALLAPPSAVVVSYWHLLSQGVMLSELGGLTWQTLVGFAVSCLVGMPLGIAMGRSETVEALARPWVGMFVVTPIAALVPLLILLCGTSFLLRVVIVFLASVWYIVLTLYNGSRGVSRAQLAVARSFGASRSRIFWKVILPSLFPYLITGARIGLVHAVRAMVLAELYVIVGYGALIQQASLDIDTSVTISLLVSLMILSLALNRLLLVAGNWLAPWYEHRQQAH
jgi:ABC-type nitrate/sulfonate/bicarbonate transport system permease component